jgi:hypothetical protein
MKIFTLYQDKTTLNKADVYYYPLFYNELLCIGNKSIYFDSWFKAGLQYIGDLFNDNGSFLTLDEINKKYNLKINIVLYLGVKRAILKMFKVNNIGDNNLIDNGLKMYRPFIPPVFKLILKPESGAKRMYNVLQKHDSHMTIKQRWSEKLKETIDDDEWKAIFLLPFKINKDTKIQWFQYRINHRIIGTNYLLHKMKIVDSPTCSFCKNSDETIEHLFWDCPITANIINTIFPSHTLPFCNKKTFILGNVNNRTDAVNIMFILTKLYIYKCKMSLSMPTVDGAKKYMQLNYEIHKTAAHLENSINKFEATWNEALEITPFITPNLNCIQ